MLNFNPELFRQLLALISEAFNTDPKDKESRMSIRDQFAEVSAKLTSFEETKEDMIQLGEALAHEILDNLKMLREKAEDAPVVVQPETPEPDEDSETPAA